MSIFDKPDGRVFKAPKGTRPDRRLGNHKAYAGDYGGVTEEKAAFAASKLASEAHPASWISPPWVDERGILKYNMYVKVPDALYRELTEPEVNEYGEVSP